MNKAQLVPLIVMLLTASASSNVFAEPAKPLSTVPIKPTCTLTTACPQTYGALDMTLTCDELADFYISDSIDGALYSYHTDSVTMTRPADTYQYNSILACATGFSPELWPQGCATFSTYYSASTWCGPQPPHRCPKNETWCGDDEGCRRFCVN